MGIKITVALLALMVKGAVERDIFLGLVGSLLQKCEDNVLMRPIRPSLGLAWLLTLLSPLSGLCTSGCSLEGCCIY